MPQTALILLADGFEEIEAVVPIDILRRAGIRVTTAALGAGPHVTGKNGLILHADSTVAAVAGGVFTCIIVPGGPAVPLLRADSRVRELVARHAAAGSWVAAICAGPTVLKDAGVLEGRRHTAHFSVHGELPAAELGERTVVDGRVITSRGAGTALDFALVVVEKLVSAESSREIARAIAA
ncbi:MAG TPA: DJ-1 family glyoxalase III [Opitutaceae bacterium]|jgi:4-methyl-5(b-hydroxyethyl)-thiazole monophosphate biosynthesis